MAGLLLLVGAAPLAAQKPGAVEFGVFGRFNSTDPQLNFDNRTGIGGRLGVFFVQNLAIEVDGSYNPLYTAEGDFVRYIPWHAGLLYNIGIGSTSAFLIGARYTDNWFREAYRETEHGIGGLLGFRLGTGGTLSIRVDGTIDYIFNPESRFSQGPPIGVQGIPSIEQDDKNLHYAVQAGLPRSGYSGPAGRRRQQASVSQPPTGDKIDALRSTPRDGLDQCPSSPPGDKVDANGCSLDTDKDTVRDAIDKCPDTPAGDKVDANGCSLPKDADADGVTDDIDQCPSSPPGDKVDATGCSVDTDKDGVRDAIDQCPDTPAGDAVDANGCSMDADKDGVSDAKDRCPTPSGCR
jgi:hypothetical protein